MTNTAVRPIVVRLPTFQQLEQTIANGLQTFVEVGAALQEIRKRKLYREKYPTFETYCRERWGISRPRAYQLIEAAGVMGNLSTNVDKPQSEGQTRPLTALPPEDQRAVWEAAVEANGPQPTAKQVLAEVMRRVEGAVAPPPQRPDPEREQEEKGLRKEMQANSERGVKLFRILDSITALACLELSTTEVAQWLETNDTPEQDWRGRTTKAVNTLSRLLKEFS